MKRVGLQAANARSLSIMEMIRNFGLDINVAYRSRDRLAHKLKEFWWSMRYLDVQSPELTADETIDEWRMYASDVELVWVPANHMTMLKLPNVQAIAELCSRSPYLQEM
jgi:thioesterase domain-containing protein